QAEDGIRDYKVTGVQTCALPIYLVGGDGMRPIAVELELADQPVAGDQRQKGQRADALRLQHREQLGELRVRGGVGDHDGHRVAQIGRASCRERVERWGGGGWVET